MEKWKIWFLLHMLLLVYSLSDICSKLAAGQAFLSGKFCLYYTMIIGLLVFYAIGWQQVIKRMPLVTAFANKAVTVVWGIIWGVCFFQESVTAGKVTGALLVMIGVVVYAAADGEHQNGLDYN